jgi:hypothetical protein
MAINASYDLSQEVIDKLDATASSSTGTSGPAAQPEGQP